MNIAKKKRTFFAYIILGAVFPIVYGAVCEEPKEAGKCAEVQGASPDCEVTKQKVCKDQYQTQFRGREETLYQTLPMTDWKCEEGDYSESCTEVQDSYCYREIDYLCERTNVGSCSSWWAGGVEYVAKVEGGEEITIQLEIINYVKKANGERELGKNTMAY